ncbi:open rectifier K[+] channel 1 isoform X2 [Nomia melanderi]|uniref:open rectifier K[+] channel 1 isoform X2 n=2 Tax=Nomia melanderi TaxID=2448451 RepID=UPI001304419D|nr:open rectifier potassium channel protein 1 isoform X1 [Nomia melanderi]XP_031839838.1 open rectifier potassium channel protein 1 isoform X1 [Nomia melanderi]XP_031839839.1 open rectifier potassium channel protein 1 isoform X1 [Nomia melanderi]XP_031839840.1 open rectifier potassium channel protein 1 isoform X1 [Nomia melanderi]XP_031839841.1 open rectifier potassium channel protein 1 isoform X1 [Nomia melanderi]XP_031839842.1 open rectifier potassium channel protein 1 isoform X1 [Nomia mela
MSKKQWMVLLMLFLTYLLLGASIFYHIESRLEIERVEKAKRERIEINALLHAYYVPNLSHDHDEILGKLTRYCGKSVYNYTADETDPLKWDFYNSFYFAYTVVSTIGYGNLAPTNMLGRILMIFYGLIGIPINGILLTQLGEFFGHVFVKAHEKYKSYKKNHARNDYCPRKLTTFETRKVGLAAQIFVYLTPGFVMFIFFPAFLFSHYEGWSYDEAVYYAFVTLTTIGFGDYVAGQDNSKGSGIFFILYKTFLICWISFGLGYIVMIMTFIARGMRSKKITRIEHKLATNLKHTQSKIWNEFNKEINYLRRVFNELQLSKVKRVYVDECHYEVPRANFPRSNSFPDLRDVLHGEKGYECFVRQRPRRRANSEVVPKEDQLGRVVSETDLQRIDKTATFASHAMVQPAELLARLVNILGYMPPAIDDIGGDCSNQTTFVQQDARRNSRIDDEIRQKVPNDISEKESTHARGSGPGGWTIGPSDRIPRFPRLRSRATSEIRLHETKKNEDRHAEWTWSGATASKTIQELMKARAYESSTKESSAKDRAAAKEQKFSTKLRSFSLAKSVPKALISSGPWKHRFSISTEKKNSDSERNGNSKDLEASFVPRETSSTRRDSDVNYASRRNYYTHTGAPNNHSERESSNLLEETSLADFVRALSFLHASVATTGNWAAAAATPTAEDRLHETRPRRKMGTASLSPPKLPSLFTLFSSNPVPSATAQANNRPVTTQPSCRDTRRGSLAFGGSTVQKSRRFSLRPVATPISPPTPPRSGSPFLPESRRTSYENKSSFLSESPKEPLIRTEDGPGFSPPMVPPSALNNARRFSLRPIQNRIGGTSTEETAASVATTLKAVPRWKSGMLQRQIGQKNLRRRVRAFSLSDVHVDDVREKVEETKSSSATRERSDSETVDESTSSRRERSTGGDQLFVTPTEHDHRDRHVSSIEPTNERYTPFSRVASTTTRLDDKTVRIADPCSRLIDRYTASNESPLCQQKIESTRDRERDRFVPVQSVTFGSFQNATVNPPINLDRKQAPLVATTDATSQHPLEQVKIETPPTTTTTFHSSFPNTNANTLSDNFLRLTEVKTEEQASRSYRDRKF